MLMCNREGVENPGLELNRGCDLIEKASTTLLGASFVHSAKTAADSISLMMLFLEFVILNYRE